MKTRHYVNVYCRTCGRTKRAHQSPKGSGDYRILCACGFEQWATEEEKRGQWKTKAERGMP